MSRVPCRSSSSRPVVATAALLFNKGLGKACVHTNTRQLSSSLYSSRCLLLDRWMNQSLGGGVVKTSCVHNTRLHRSKTRIYTSASQCAQDRLVDRTLEIMRDMGSKVLDGIVSNILLVWWMLPYCLRAWFKVMCCTKSQAWPPQYNRRHVLLPLSTFLTGKPKSKRHMARSLGIDELGRSHKLARRYFHSWMIEELIGMGIQNRALYLEALMHPSALKPEQRHLSYERLEYLGDAALELAVREMLMDRIPTADEGISTFQTQALVRGDTISMISAWIGLDKFIVTNAYSMRSSLLKSPSILCDAFEALLGAIYIEKGLNAVKCFLERVYTECPLIDWDQFTLERNFVTELQRKANEGGYSIPQYITVYTPDAPYTVQVFLNGCLGGDGSSHDLRIAKQIAAKSTLDIMACNSQ